MIDEDNLKEVLQTNIDNIKALFKEVKKTRDLIGFITEKIATPRQLEKINIFISGMNLTK